MIYLEILAIAAVCVIVTDVLQFFFFFYPILSKLLGFKAKLPAKPFKCSTCQTHWIGLIVLIVVGKWTIFNYAYLLAVSASTPLLNTLWWNIQGIIGLIINLLKIRS